MRLLEFENISEVFTPQIEGWYNVDDIRIWFAKNYNSKIANAWDEATSGLVTEIPVIQQDQKLIDEYKEKDIEIMNDWLSGLFPFKMIDLQYHRGKAIWKVMEEELEEDWKNVARAGLATAALGMGVAGMDSVTPDDFAPDKPQAVKSVDNDIDRDLTEFEKSSKEFNDLYNKYIQKFTDEAKNSFDRNHIKDKAELQTIKHWLKMFNSRADFTDYLNKTYPDRVKAQQDTNINNTMPNSMPDRVGENFADGKKKGKSRPGRVKRAGASCDGSVTSLRKKAKDSSGEKAKMYHWCANMKSGRNKK